VTGGANALPIQLMLAWPGFLTAEDFVPEKQKPLLE